MSKRRCPCCGRCTVSRTVCVSGAEVVRRLRCRRCGAIAHERRWTPAMDAHRIAADLMARDAHLHPDGDLVAGEPEAGS